MSTENLLKKNALGTTDVISQALAFMGPVMSMAFLTMPIAAYAGSAAPLAVLIAGLVMIALGYVISQFAMRVHAAGAIYNYAAKAFGPETGFVGGWVYLFAVLCLTVAIIAGVGGWITEYLGMAFGLVLPPWAWLIFVALECVVLYYLAYFDVRISTKTQLVLVLGSVAIVALLAGFVIIKGGAAGHSGAPFSFAAAGGFSGLSQGLIFALLMYTGFESAAVLAEETSDPKKSMPIAIVGTVVAAVVLYIFVMYAYAIGFGVDNSAAWAGSGAALLDIAGMYGGDWLVTVVFLAAIVDGFAVALGCLTTVARVMYAIGRDGALPSALGRTHPVHKTPHIANGVVLAISLICSVIFSFVFAAAESGLPPYMVEFLFLAGVGGITIEAIYVFVSIAAIAWFRRELKGEYNVLKHLVAPLVAVLGAGAALYGSFLPSLNPEADPLTRSMPYVALVWIIAGLAYIFYLRSSQPGLVAKIGRDLNEMESGEPVVDTRFNLDQ